MAKIPSVELDVACFDENLDQAGNGDPLIGVQLDGRYTITHRIGCGGMGAVYAAVQHSIGREVAIKVVAPEYSGSRSTAKRFLREVWIASRLRSPNIAAIHDFGQTEDGLVYMVMELIEGATLAAELYHGGPLSPVRAVQIAMQICRALEAAHGAGVVHRDLKPGNVMLTGRCGDEAVTVLDFGLAKSITGSNIGVTETGIIIGTARYIAPELVRGDEPEATADLYSLGALLYAMLAGAPPFVGDELSVLQAQVLKPPPALPSSVPVELAEVVDRLLAKQPSDRFAGAIETREALALSLSTTEPLAAAPILYDDDDADTEVTDIIEREDDSADYLMIDTGETTAPARDLGPEPTLAVSLRLEPPPRNRLLRRLAIGGAILALLAALVCSGGLLGSGPPAAPGDTAISVATE